MPGMRRAGELRRDGTPAIKIYSEKRFFQFFRLDYHIFSAILNALIEV